MHRFLLKLTLYAFWLYLVFFVIDNIYSRMLNDSSISAEAWNSLIKGDINADVIVMGNSRARCQYNTMILDSVLKCDTYNLGMEASPFNRQIHKYEVYRYHNEKPRLIIQNIDFRSMAYLVGYDKEQLYPYFYDKGVRDAFFPDEPYSIAEKYIPCFRYHGYDPVEIIRSGRHSTLQKGYDARKKQWNGVALSKLDSLGFVINDTTACMFDEYLSKTISEGIKILFVYAPIYYAVEDKIVNIDEMNQTFKMYAQKYNIPILDYRMMSICRDTCLFYNGLHLNSRGADIFTDTLAKDIQRLFMLKNDINSNSSIQ